MGARGHHRAPILRSRIQKNYGLVFFWLPVKFGQSDSSVTPGLPSLDGLLLQISLIELPLAELGFRVEKPKTDRASAQVPNSS